MLDQIKEAMQKSASALRALKEENAQLREEISRRDRHARAEKIANLASARGLMEAEEAYEYAEKLAHSNDDLDMVEDFVERTVTGVPLGQLQEKSASYEGSSEADALTTFLLNSELAG